MNASTDRFSLDKVSKRSASLPDRIVLYGPPSWGKTSFAARLPAPIFLMSPGEDRLKKLIEQGLCPETPHFPELAQSWDDVQTALQVLTAGAHDFRTLVIDTGNGVERLAQELVCEEEYGGNWGETGFARYGVGEKVAADRLWAPFLASLDRLREQRRMRIVLVCHTGIQSVKNPEGGDYDKVVPALSKRAWSYTAKWADMILYGSLELQIGKDDPKSRVARNKAKGGRVRLLHCQPTAAYESKNVHRLPATIRLGDDPHKAYEHFRAAFPQLVKEGKNKAQTGKESKAKDSVPPEKVSPHEDSPAAQPACASTLEELRAKMAALHFTPAHKEEWCAQYGVPTIELASEEQARQMSAELTEMLAEMKRKEAACEPGEDEPEE